MAARTPTIVTTTISSMSVNPWLAHAASGTGEVAGRRGLHG
jgi:hypothetical protein